MGRPKISPRELVELKKKWNRKLRASGFKDAERYDQHANPKDLLRNNQQGEEVHDDIDYTYYVTTYEYYQRWARLAHELPLDRPVDRVIAERLAEGQSYKKIAKVVGMTPPQLRKHIEKLVKQEGILTNDCD